MLRSTRLSAVPHSLSPSLPLSLSETRYLRTCDSFTLIRRQKQSFELEATRAELTARDNQLEASYKDQNELMLRLEQAYAELSEEHIGRIAAEKALDSLQVIVEDTLIELRSLEQEREATEHAHQQEAMLHHQKVAQLEEDIQYASKEAKLYLHRELEALAEIENQKETIDRLQSQVVELQTKVVELQTKVAFEGTENKATGSKGSKGSSTARVVESEVVADLLEMEQALEEETRATKRRSYEIRAEAALLVETVEDRAVELVEKAQLEVALLKRELDQLREDENR